MKYNYALLGALASAVSAHTWVEQLMVIAPNGTLAGNPGFPRGNVKRTAPGFGDPVMVNLIPSNDRPANQILPADPICKNTQTKQSQTDGSPRLQASAGDNIALRYQENGHVSLPQNQPGKPDNRGTVYVYGTTQPQENDAFLSIHRVWNAAGTGGDGRGVLLSTQNYDDGQCYQVNSGQISATRQKTFAHAFNPVMGSDLWCQQDIQIPTTTPSGKPYTLYWVWDWPTMPGTPGAPDGKQEIYTTCMDVDITAAGGQGGSGGTGGSQNKAAANSFVQGQDVAYAGIASQLANVANPTAVTGQFIPFLGASGQPSSATGSSGGQPSSASPLVASASTSLSVVSQSSPVPASTATAVTSSTASSQLPVNTPSSNPAPPTSRTHRSRPTISPINPQDPTSTSTSNQDNPPAQAGQNNLNTGTAIANTNTNTVAAAPATSTTTIIAPPTTITQTNSIFQTVTQTKVETVFASASASANQKRAAEAITPSVAIRGTTASVYPSIRACSRTESVYRLRARSPFYILPTVDVASEAGC